MGYIVYSLEEGWYATINPNTSVGKTKEREKAYVWDTEVKARNVMKHQLSKEKAITYVKVDPKSIHEPIEKAIAKDFSIEEILAKTRELSVEMDQKIRFLKDALSYCDRREQDLLHEVEDSKYNVCEGYKYYKRMQDLRKERRRVKNEMKKIENLNMMGITKNNIDKALRSAEKVGSVVRYTPRTCEEERERYGV